MPSHCRSSAEIAPLGVGINLQPNAVREPLRSGIGADALDKVGLPALNGPWWG